MHLVASAHAHQICFFASCLLVASCPTHCNVLSTCCSCPAAFHLAKTKSKAWSLYVWPVWPASGLLQFSLCFFIWLFFVCGIIFSRVLCVCSIHLSPLTHVLSSTDTWCCQGQLYTTLCKQWCRWQHCYASNGQITLETVLLRATLQILDTLES